MSIFKIYFALFFLLASSSFAKDDVQKGPKYLEGKYYSVGKKTLDDGAKLGEESEVRFWSKSISGEDKTKKALHKIAQENSNEITKLAKTHKANAWFWQKIKDNEYFMIGYSDATNSQFSYASVKKRGDYFIYSCNNDGSWKKIENDESASCRLKKGYNTIKFQFYNPDNGKGWGSDDIIYKFIILNR